MWKQNRMKTIMIVVALVAGMTLSACATGNEPEGTQVVEIDAAAQQTPEAEQAQATIEPAVKESPAPETQTGEPAVQESLAPEMQTSGSIAAESTAAPTQPEKPAGDAATMGMPILDEIEQNVQIGTAGAYLTAVKAAANMLDWGIATGLDSQEIKAATIAWLMDKGNDAQVAFADKLRQVDDAYHKLLGPDAQELLESAGCANAAYPWSDAPVEAIEAVMDAVGLRPYEASSAPSEDWKAAFEESLMNNYQVAPHHYEDLGDGVYQVYVVIDGKVVPYVAVDSKTGNYHG